MFQIPVQTTSFPTPYYLTDQTARAISWIVQTSFLPGILVATAYANNISKNQRASHQG